MAESFFARLECELIDRRSFQSKAEARLALFTYIEGWYNPRRRHLALGRVSPIQFERRYDQRQSPVTMPQAANRPPKGATPTLTPVRLRSSVALTD
jgi:hypothetical protein